MTFLPRARSSVGQSIRLRTRLFLPTRAHTAARCGMQNPKLARIARELQELAGARNDTFADGAEAYRARRVTEHHLRPSTIVEYHRALDRAISVLGEIRIDSLRAEDVEAYLGSLPSTILPSHFSVVSACLRWLDRRGGYPGLAALVPERRPRRRRYTEALSDAEYRTVWEGLEEARVRRWAWRRIVDSLRLLTLVPLRCGEAATLAWPEIDATGRRILLSEAKTGDRVIPVPPVAMSIILRQPRRSRYVFPGREDRGHVHGSSMSHAWVRILSRIGVRRLRLHALRHSWASRAVRQGVPLEIVRRVLGHTTEHMAAVYAHLGADAARGAVDAMERSIVCDSIQLQLPIGGDA